MSEASPLPPREIARLARDRFGPENRHTSGRQVLRFGRSGGSLVVYLAGPRAGWWFDWSERATAGWCGRLDQAPGERRPAPAAFVPQQFVADPARLPRVRELMAAAQPAEGTPADRYLEGRGITRRPLPSSVRFVDARLESGWRVHAMLCAARDHGGRTRAVQLVHLTAAGRKDPASWRPVKQTLGAGEHWAPFAGLRLPCTRPMAELHLCEGPETGLSVWQVDGAPVWVGFGLSHLGSVRTRRKRVTVIRDPDEEGSGGYWAAGRVLAQLAGRYERVRWIMSERGAAGDLNDLLQAEGEASVRRVLRAPQTYHEGPPLDREQVAARLATIGRRRAEWLAQTQAARPAQPAPGPEQR